MCSANTPPGLAPGTRALPNFAHLAPAPRRPRARRPRPSPRPIGWPRGSEPARGRLRPDCIRVRGPAGASQAVSVRTCGRGGPPLSHYNPEPPMCAVMLLTLRLGRFRVGPRGHLALECDGMIETPPGQLRTPALGKRAPHRAPGSRRSPPPRPHPSTDGASRASCRRREAPQNAQRIWASAAQIRPRRHTRTHTRNVESARQLVDYHDGSCTLSRGATSRRIAHSATRD